MRGDYAMKPIFLKPTFKERIWGGDRLKTEFGFNIPSDHIGEAWVISAHPNGVSTITYPDYHLNKGLDELYRERSHLFGKNPPKEFPLLVKIIDAKEDLSVQVHPNDDYAYKHEGEQGKAECWYILDAEPDATIIYGHEALEPEDFEKMIEEGQWSDLLTKVKVKPGDFFDVPAGTIHAIGKGIMLLEIQQSSDTTYRLYDYDRKDNEGNYRELHLQQAKEVTQVPHHDSPFNRRAEEQVPDSILRLIETPYYKVERIKVSNRVDLTDINPYLMLTVIDGKGYLDMEGQHYEIRKGNSFILPKDSREATFTGQLDMIMAKPTNYH